MRRSTCLVGSAGAPCVRTDGGDATGVDHSGVIALGAVAVAAGGLGPWAIRRRGVTQGR